MDDTTDTIAERFRECIRARALVHAHAQHMPPSSKAVRRGALLLAVLLHLILALWIHFAAQPTPTDDGDRIEVRLLNAPPAEPSLPEPPSAPLRTNIPSSNRRAVQVPVPPPSPPRTEAATQEEAPLHLFSADGSVAIPRENADSTAVQGNAFVSPVVAPSPLLQTRRPIKLRPNHFAGAWRAPANENLLGTALRKTAELVDEKLTVRKEFKTAWGSKVKCQASYMLVMALAGCGWGIAPKPYEAEERWKPATVFDEE